MNRAQQANDALASVLDALATARGGTFHRNLRGSQPWAGDAVFIQQEDDLEPEVLRVLSGPIYDLKLEVELLMARKGKPGDRMDDEWADIEALKAALKVDPTLGGKVEDARISGGEAADLDKSKWLGGGRYVTVRLLTSADSPLG